MADREYVTKIKFIADTNDAKQKIQSLYDSLQGIATRSSIDVDPTSLQRASTAAQELQGYLRQATNVNTGKLDLSRFSTSLKVAGKDLEHYRQELTAIGPEGEQAFNQLAMSIASAEAPVFSLGTKMNQMLTTLKNTARWMLSSGLLRGITSTVSGAVQYTKELDKSLTSIQIVTKKSSDQMADFAKNANKAAKELSVQTKAYTDASLIYFQQGKLKI